MINIRRCCCYYTSYTNGDIDYKRMKELISKYPTIIIDVRSEQEFREGHINGAINVPLYRIKSDIPKRINDKEKYIILYCTSGIRSKKAQNILSDLGYINVYNLISGFSE